MKKLLYLLLTIIIIFVSCEEESDNNGNEQKEPLSATYEVTDVTEYGGNDGSITVTATGGVTPYFYVLQPNGSILTGEFTGLSAGNYKVNVYDSAGDSVVFNGIVIEEPSVDNIVITISAENVSTYNGNDGSATITASGGIAPYSYKLNDNSYVSTNIFENLVAGNYTVTVKDSRDTIKTKDFTITQPEYTEMTITYEKTNITINGFTDGSITINVSGGLGNYQYKLNDGEYSSNNVFENLSVGTYSFTVMDDVKDSTITGIEITQPDVLVATAEETGAGEITVNATGGVGGYTYKILLPDSTFQESNVFTNLPDDTYRFVVQDANGAFDTTDYVGFTTHPELQIGDEYLGGIVFVLSGTYPNQHGMVVYNDTYVSKTWDNANTYCNNLTSNGNDNWYLPNYNQLNSILTEYLNGNINLTIYEAEQHWTSITCDIDSYSYLGYYNSEILDGCEHKNNTYFYLPVSEF